MTAAWSVLTELHRNSYSHLARRTLRLKVCSMIASNAAELTNPLRTYSRHVVHVLCPDCSWLRALELVLVNGLSESETELPEKSRFDQVRVGASLGRVNLAKTPFRAVGSSELSWRLIRRGFKPRRYPVALIFQYPIAEAFK